MRKIINKKVLFFLAVSMCISLGFESVFAATEITLWGINSPTFMEATKILIDRFEQENPGVKVNYEVFPYDGFNQKMAITASAGTGGPDISQCWGEYARMYIDAEGLAPVPDWVLTKQEFKQLIYAASRGAISSGGEFYAVPIELNIGDDGIITNLDLLDEAGIPHRSPETWDEMVEWAKKLTKYDEEGNVILPGFAYTNSTMMTCLMTRVMRQHGKGIRAADGLHFDVDNSIAYKAMGLVVDLTTKHRVNSIDVCYDVHGNQPYDVFMRNQAAMSPCGPWVVGLVKSLTPELNFGYVSMPYFGESPYFYAENGWSYAVLEASEHKTESWKLVKLFSEPKNMREWTLMCGMVPARKDVAADPLYLEGFPEIEVIMDSLPYAKWFGPVGDRDRVFKEGGFYTHILQAIRGEKTVEKACKDLNSFLNAVIDEYY